MKITQLSGGVGGARMARGFAALNQVQLTVIVNVADDADNLGLRVSPDLDTVIYTLAGVEGPFGWGRSKETFRLNEELARFGVDNTFRMGDTDLALKLYRTHQMGLGRSLSDVTKDITSAFDLDVEVLPATDDRLRTEVRISDTEWISFQEYFVVRRAEDEVLELRFTGAAKARPAPGALDAITDADMVVIAPSNPPLSISPILSIPGVETAVRSHPNVVAVSPLIGGKPIKGPADRVLISLGLPPGNAGIARAYDGLIDKLVIDSHDADDIDELTEVDVVATDTLIKQLASGMRLASELADL